MNVIKNALNLYKSETNGMCIQTAAQITQQHFKEIKIKEDEMNNCSKKRQELEIREKINVMTCTIIIIN